MTLRSAAVIALLAAGLSPAPASAKVLDAEACSENVPPVSAQYIRNHEDPSIIHGAVQLRRDTCYQYWGYVQFYDPIPSGARGNAFLVWWEEGVRQYILSCDDAGGNGFVLPGQTTCRTPKHSRVAVDGFMASAHFQIRTTTGGWFASAFGQTAIMPGGT